VVFLIRYFRRMRAASSASAAISSRSAARPSSRARWLRAKASREAGSAVSTRAPSASTIFMLSTVW
jgi:hypothetical protein